MAKSYFAQDGSWGDAENIEIVDTTTWPWWWPYAIAGAGDTEMMTMARDLNDYAAMGYLTPDSLLLEWVTDNHPEWKLEVDE